MKSQQKEISKKELKTRSLFSFIKYGICDDFISLFDVIDVWLFCFVGVKHTRARARLMAIFPGLPG